MSDSMAAILGNHYVNYYPSRDWECTSLQCGFKAKNFSDAMEHVAEVLAANGYGKLEEASRELKFLRGERKTLGKELDHFESQGHATVTIKYLRRFIGRRPE